MHLRSATNRTTPIILVPVPPCHLLRRPCISAVAPDRLEPSLREMWSFAEQVRGSQRQVTLTHLLRTQQLSSRGVYDKLSRSFRIPLDLSRVLDLELNTSLEVLVID